MNAVEILNEVLKGVDEGVEACFQRPNAYTVNHQVGSILNHIRQAVLAAKNEIEKGNAE